ncbi:MAG TPA: RagB/SusD family nutrient uptake outer membrane protein [Bacteroidales bacterium]|nr:RagB/SusD family nutrient uptake outer membrane protein [Bacteroidales bacterium]
MKNKLFLMIALTTGLVFSSCQNFLSDSPESVLTQVGFYTNPTRINQGILGCYSGIAITLKDEWMYTELRSDNTCQFSTGSSSTARVDQADVAFFRTSPSFPLLQDYWYKVFQNISNINAVLPSVKDNSFVPIESQRAQYEAELLFMRAYHYYNLVNLFGDMFKITTVIGPNEAKQTVRSPVSEIYDQIIIPDLIKAGNQAPASYPASETGRVTKWAAKSLLAKTYMMLGGEANLAKAKTLLQEVMTAPQVGLLIGTDAYAKIFSITNEMNKEIIFAVRYKGGGLGLGSPFWGTFAPEGSANTFLKIGTPLGYNSPTNEIMNLFNSNPKDSRKNACFSVWNKSLTVAVPYVSKFTDATMSQAFQSENDWIILRYADIVLLYAEILAQDGHFSDAHTEVNKIRTRSGLNPMAAFESPIQALDSIYQERRLELAFENQRWFDLLRMAKSYNNPDKPIEILKKHVFETDWALFYSKYNPIPVPEERFFKKERLLLPIPQSEIDTNNEMVIPQNADY